MMNTQLFRPNNILALFNKYRARITIYRTFLLKKDRKSIIDAGTMENVWINIANTMGVSRDAYDHEDDSSGRREKLTKYFVKDQKELPIRTMNDSFVMAVIPLSKNPTIRLKYTSFTGTIRIGRLLEDMDMFAGCSQNTIRKHVACGFPTTFFLVYVAELHILNPNLPKDKPSPYTIVTALVDKIEFTNIATNNSKDIRLSGITSWVGTSSLEVTVWLEQQNEQDWVLLTKARFLMAARDPTTTKSAIINALKTTTPEEEEILKHAKERRIKKSNTNKNIIPTPEEQERLHKIYLRTLETEKILGMDHVLPPNCDWIENYKMSNLIRSHPEHRNLHNNVFGGFLMRSALELSFGLGYFFCRTQPILKAISDITFTKPISLGSIIHMHASIVCTQEKRYQIITIADTWAANGTNIHTSNTFQLTFMSEANVKELFPKTYKECMQYIEGYRILKTIE